MTPIAEKLIGVPTLQAPAVIGDERTQESVELQTQFIGSSTISMIAGSVLLVAWTSFGLVTTAVFVRKVGALEALTFIVMLENIDPTPSGLSRSQENEESPGPQVQVHPRPSGTSVSVTPLGRLSVTIVRDAGSAPFQTLVTITV